MVMKIGAFGGAILLATSGPAFAHGGPLGDPEIAHVAYTAGQIDVGTARLALERSRNPKVRAFAETMVRDHQAVNTQALALTERLHVTPQANPTSASLTSQAAEARKRLEGLNGRAFDRVYVANEAIYHRAVNDALRGTLIPSAHNPELKALLEAGLTLFSAHQDHAEHLAQELR